MRSRLLVILLATIAVVGTLSIVIGASKSSSNNTVATPPASTVVALKNNPPNTINGATNPELIPDHVAYSLLFRFLANRENEGDKKAIRAYIRQMGLGKKKCKDCEASETQDTDIDSLLAVAEEFNRRVAVLDRQAFNLRVNNQSPRSPQVMAQLADLQRQKEALVEEIIASLPQHLSVDAMKEMRNHINERVKRKIKMASSQSPS